MVIMEAFTIHYFGTFDGDGNPTGFYPSDVWSDETRPAEAIEITEVQYLVLLKDENARWVNGEVVIDEAGRPMSAQ